MATDQANTAATSDITPTEADLARDLRAFYQRIEVEKNAELHCSYGVWPTLLAALRRAIAAEARVKELEAELQRLCEDAEDQRLEWQFRDTCGE